ncbi:MAG: hypothetical protein ACYC5O_13820 [Anaerolineae bacterium]
MAFNPLTEKGTPIDRQTQNWAQLNVQPYDKSSVDPYTRCRIILMNGIEVEAAIFLHQFARHADDTKLKQQLAMTRRAEQQQQKAVNWLVPGNESTLEVTIGYEQVAVDLTAYLARTEPDPYVKQALDFALLEDFDHLYRYSNLLDMDQGMDAAKIVGNLTEITPGRPTTAEHRHPFDDVRKHYDSKSADILTKLHVATITAGEQQTMNLYMVAGDRYVDELGRGLYLEIAQIEEQHVSHYESLADPTTSWLEMAALHDYNEAYLYYSCMESEADPRIKRLWEHNLMMEIEHLRLDGELLKQYEKREIGQLFPSSFPELTIFQSNKDYVREVLASQVDLSAEGTEMVPVSRLRDGSRYRTYQEQVNGGGFVPSQEVIETHIERFGQDYRLETEGQHPVPNMRSRTTVPGLMARV